MDNETEKLREAFNAGDKLANQKWHIEEFCIGQFCKCKGVTLNYSNFEEWVSKKLPPMVAPSFPKGGKSLIYANTGNRDGIAPSSIFLVTNETEKTVESAWNNFEDARKECDLLREKMKSKQFMVVELHVNYKN